MSSSIQHHIMLHHFCTTETCPDNSRPTDDICHSVLKLFYVDNHLQTFTSTKEAKPVVDRLRKLLADERSKMAPQMAATVLCSSVFVLFLFVFPVFCFSNTISFTRDDLLNIRQNTPQNLLPDFDYSDVFWTL